MVLLILSFVGVVYLLCDSFLMASSRDEQPIVPMTDLQQVFGHLQAQVVFQRATGAIYVKRGNDALAFQVGSAVARHNRMYKKMMAPITLDAVTRRPFVSVHDIYPFFHKIKPNIEWSDEQEALEREFADAAFPLIRGSYKPFVDTFGAPRYFDAEDGVRGHEGTDIFARTGVPIFAAYDGLILECGWSERGGWRLTIQVGPGTTTFYYAHLVKYAPGIRTGATVKKGQLIGFVGSTGYGPLGTTGKFKPHLHFGIYDSNVKPWTAFNSYSFLKRWE